MGRDDPGLNLVHLNVCSLLAGNRFELLKTQIVDSEFDVFSVSETWLTEALPNGLIEIKGYNVARLDRGWRDGRNGNETKRGGGLACYVKDHIQMSATRFCHLNKSLKYLEMQWISVRVQGMRHIAVINIYRPPQGDYEVACKMINEAIVEADLKDNAEIFLMGDFNINFKDKTLLATKELDFITGSNGLFSLVSGTTRRSFREGVERNTCIDLIFSNSTAVARTGIEHKRSPSSLG